MAGRRSVVVNGDLGSGKTTVSKLLATRLGIRRISVGDIYREIARRKGMTALQLNRHAELDDEVDGYVDRLQREIADSGEQLVVDSRLAWFFFTQAFKVHLITEVTVAARRVLARPSSQEEAYGSVEEATLRLRERSDSERDRFLVRYGADKCRLRNYDLVCDSTRATPEEIVDHIVAVFEGEPAGGTGRPRLLLDPARIHPTRDAPVVPERPSADPADLVPLPVGHVDGEFFLVEPDGTAAHQRLSAARLGGLRLAPAWLVAEGDEPVVAGGMSAREYFATVVAPGASGRGMVGAWRE